MSSLLPRFLSSLFCRPANKSTKRPKIILKSRSKRNYASFHIKERSFPPVVHRCGLEHAVTHNTLNCFVFLAATFPLWRKKYMWFKLFTLNSLSKHVSNIAAHERNVAFIWLPQQQFESPHIHSCNSTWYIPKSCCTCLGTPATVLRLLSFLLLWSTDCEWTSEQRTLASLSKPTPATETGHLRNLCLVATAAIPSLPLSRCLARWTRLEVLQK